MPMHTMELVLSEVLFQRLEQVARPAGISVSELILQLLKRWFGEMTMAELEQKEIEAYKQMPVAVGEFDVWENEQG